MTKEPVKPHNYRSDILYAFLLAGVAYLAWQLRDLLIILYVSALFAVVLKPVVLATGRIRIGRRKPFQGPIALLVLVVALVGALVGFGFLAIPPVIHDLQSFGSSTPSRVPDLLDKIKNLPLVSHLNLNTGAIYARLQSMAAATATQALMSVSTLAGKIADLMTGLVLTMYFLLEGDDAYEWCLSFVPPERRQRLNTTLRRAGVGMGKWLLGQLTLMALLGLTSATAFVLLDVRYAYALGVIAGLLNLIPVLGATIALVLAMLVAALDSWGRVVGVVIFFAVYLQIENSYLAPRIMKSRVGLPSLAVFIALLIGFDLAGILGAMVAVPTAVLVAVLLNEYLLWKETEEAASD